jgi:hypothetical protein
MEQHRGAVFAAAFASWFGTVLGAVVCAGELALSDTIPWTIAFPAMANGHMLIGLGRGLATGLIILASAACSPRARCHWSRTRFFNTIGGCGVWSDCVPGIVLFVLRLLVHGLMVWKPWPIGWACTAVSTGAPLADYRFPFSVRNRGDRCCRAVGTLVAFVAAYAWPLRSSRC